MERSAKPESYTIKIVSYHASLKMPWTAQAVQCNVRMLLTFKSHCWNGWRTSIPRTFQPQASIPDLSTPDFSTMNFSTPGPKIHGWKVRGLKVHSWKVWGWKVRVWDVLQPFLFHKPVGKVIEGSTPMFDTHHSVTSATEKSLGTVI